MKTFFVTEYEDREKHRCAVSVSREAAELLNEEAAAMGFKTFGIREVAGESAEAVFLAL